MNQKTNLNYSFKFYKYTEIKYKYIIKSFTYKIYINNIKNINPHITLMRVHYAMIYCIIYAFIHNLLFTRIYHIYFNNSFYITHEYFDNTDNISLTAINTLSPFNQCTFGHFFNHVN